MKEFIKASSFAGACIGIGCVANIMSGNRYIGAFLFSFALLTVISERAELFTGKIGYIDKYKKLNCLDMLPLMLIFNIFGAAFVAGAISFALPMDVVASIAEAKMEQNFLEASWKSVFCGVVMYVAVNSNNMSESKIFVIMSIATFVISGFEHSIANTFYFASYSILGGFKWKMVLLLIIYIVGNATGSIMAREFTYGKKVAYDKCRENRA